MNRNQEWPRILSEFLAEKANQPFSWGENDCLLFCADAVLSMTGTDHAAEFRGQYTDEARAYAALQSAGYADAEQVLTAKLGEPKPVKFAHRGDIVLYGNAGGVVDMTGRYAALYAVNRGLVRVPLHQCSKALEV